MDVYSQKLSKTFWKEDQDGHNNGSLQMKCFTHFKGECNTLYSIETKQQNECQQTELAACQFHVEAGNMLEDNWNHLQHTENKLMMVFGCFCE
jgi:hypothetical protein